MTPITTAICNNCWIITPAWISTVWSQPFAVKNVKSTTKLKFKRPIPTLPPTKLRSEFVHVGEDWSFINQAGDVLPNHIVDTYRRAVEAEVETNQERSFPLSGTD